MTTTRESEQPRASGRLLRGIESVVTQLWSWGPLYFLIAISLGLAIWPLTDIQELDYIVKNDLTIAKRHQVLFSIGISFIVTTTAYLAVWLRRRRREPGLTLGESFAQANRWAFVLLIAPLWAGLSVLRVEVKHPVFTAFMMVAVVALAIPFIHRALGLKWFAPPADPFVQGRLPGLARAVFGASIVMYVAVMLYFTFLDHYTLGTSVYDLGIYNNLVWQTAHGYFLDCTLIKGGNHVSAHFDPILWFIAQIYRVYQHAETLLVLQTLWLASGAFAVRALALRKLRNEWMAAILTIVYFLYPGLHGVNMFDFHSLALIIPTMMWAIYFLDGGAYKRYWAMVALLLITREDISLINCLMGTYAIMSGRVRTGLVTIVVSALYLIGVKTFAMADSSLLMAADKAYSYVYYYDEMIPHPKEGTRGLLTTLLTNPLWALQVIFKEEKLLFFLHLFLPLLAVPFVAGRKAVMYLYGLLFIALASRKHVYSLHFQYSALLIPMFFAALPDGIVRITDSRRLRALGYERARVAWTLVLGMLVATSVVSAKYGAIFPNSSFKAGWSRPARGVTEEMHKRYAKLQEMIAQVGPDAAISASNEVGPHISNRRKAYHWPTINDADYLMLRVDGVFFKKEEKKKLERLIKRNKFRLIDEGFGLQLLQRVDEEELDAEFRGEARGGRPFEIPSDDDRDDKKKTTTGKADDEDGPPKEGEGPKEGPNEEPARADAVDDAGAPLPTRLPGAKPAGEPGGRSAAGRDEPEGGAGP